MKSRKLDDILKHLGARFFSTNVTWENEMAPFRFFLFIENSFHIASTALSNKLLNNLNENAANIEKPLNKPQTNYKCQYFGICLTSASPSSSHEVNFNVLRWIGLKMRGEERYGSKILDRFHQIWFSIILNL